MGEEVRHPSVDSTRERFNEEEFAGMSREIEGSWLIHFAINCPLPLSDTLMLSVPLAENVPFTKSRVLEMETTGEVRTKSP